MSLNFPDTSGSPPTDGSFTHTENGLTYSWDGEKWNLVTEANNGGVNYVLPTATAIRLGGIKVGENLTVEPDGTLNASDGAAGTLQEVTDAGNHTTNDILIGNTEGSPNITFNADGSALFSGKVTSDSTEASDPGTTLVTKDFLAGSGGIGGVDLQAVTDVGNTTTNGAAFGGNVDIKTDATPWIEVGYGTDGSANHRIQWDSSKLTFSSDASDAVASSGFIFNVDTAQALIIDSAGNGTWTGFVSSGDQSSGTFSVMDDVGIFTSYKAAGTPDATTAFQVVRDGDLQFQVRADGEIQIGGDIPSNPNITLHATGSAEIVGKFTAGTVEIQPYSDTSGLIIFENGNSSNATVYLKQDGSAVFDGFVQSGPNDPMNTYKEGAIMAGGSGFVACYSNDDSPLWRGYKEDNNQPTSRINVDGSAIFEARVNVGTSTLDDRAVSAYNTSTTVAPVSAANYNPAGQVFQGYNATVDPNFASSTIRADGSVRLGGTPDDPQVVLDGPTGSATFHSTVSTEGDSAYYSVNRTATTASSALYLGFVNDAEVFKIGTDGGGTFTGRGTFGSTITCGSMTYADPYTYLAATEIALNTNSSTTLFKVTDNGSVLVGGTIPAAPNITLSAGGDIYANNVICGSVVHDGGGGTYISKSEVAAYAATPTSYVWRGWDASTGDSNTLTSYIQGNGDAEFAGNVLVGDDAGTYINLDKSGTITLANSNSNTNALQYGRPSQLPLFYVSTEGAGRFNEFVEVSSPGHGVSAGSTSNAWGVSLNGDSGKSGGDSFGSITIQGDSRADGNSKILQSFYGSTETSYITLSGSTYFAGSIQGRNFDVVPNTAYWLRVFNGTNSDCNVIGYTDGRLMLGGSLDGTFVATPEPNILLNGTDGSASFKGWVDTTGRVTADVTTDPLGSSYAMIAKNNHAARGAFLAENSGGGLVFEGTNGSTTTTEIGADGSASFRVKAQVGAADQINITDYGIFLKDTGNADAGNANVGIDTNGTITAANLSDGTTTVAMTEVLGNSSFEIEEGVWTPTISSTFNMGGATFTATNSVGNKYTRVGQLVTCTAQVSITVSGDVGHNWNQGFVMRGLPFTSNGLVNCSGSSVSNLSTASLGYSIWTGLNGPDAYFIYSGPSNAANTMTFTNGSIINVFIQYYTPD